MGCRIGTDRGGMGRLAGLAWGVIRGAGRADPADVAAAFRELGLQDWLRWLPQGLDTRVGQRGEDLSAGEAQMVALARAQIAEPSVLILDEATSAVDPETERALSEALRRLSEGRTTVTIAHRLSTAEAADWVFVFDQGRLVEQGRHADLLALGAATPTSMRAGRATLGRGHDLYTRTRAERGLQ